MKYIAISCFLVAMSALAPTAARAQAAPADRWQPVRFMLGSWLGEARGEPGKGSVERDYQLVLDDKFIEEHNTSRYEPKAAGKEPEVHQHRSFISYDKARKTLMLRQFHEERFVILYAMNVELSTPTRLVFDSVNFENFSNEWKARETYEVKSNDEFVETFELAAPGRDFEVYSHNHFRRRLQ
jgi:hypothetical protein